MGYQRICPKCFSREIGFVAPRAVRAEETHAVCLDCEAKLPIGDFPRIVWGSALGHDVNGARGYIALEPGHVDACNPYVTIWTEGQHRHRIRVDALELLAAIQLVAPPEEDDEPPPRIIDAQRELERKRRELPRIAPAFPQAETVRESANPNACPECSAGPSICCAHKIRAACPGCRWCS